MVFYTKTYESFPYEDFHNLFSYYHEFCHQIFTVLKMNFLWTWAADRLSCLQWIIEGDLFEAKYFLQVCFA